MSQRRNMPFALGIEAKNTEENIKAQKGMQYRRARVIENEPTTATYVNSLIFDKRLIKTVLITIEETVGAQSIYYKLLGCIDPADWHEIIGETSLAAGAHTAINLSDSWAYIKLQTKSNSGSGTVLAFMSGQTP